MSETSLVRVTITATRGSTPREVGTSMLVGHDFIQGTIGGGRLEWEAIQLARELLDPAAGAASCSREWVLGPELGQCCGGRVSLQLERLQQRPSDPGKPVAAGGRQLLLFGAGHVAQAIGRALHDVPDFDLRCFDTRRQIPGHDPAALPYLHVADPVRIAAGADAASLVLVMTHDHALDYELCRAVLSQPRPVLWLGLIASQSKAARFRSRLTREGLGQRATHLLCAPIGIPGIHGKAPAVIAISVLAQLLIIAQSQATDARTRVATAEPGCAAANCGNCGTPRSSETFMHKAFP